MTTPIEIERAQRYLDRLATCHPSQLQPDNPTRLLFDIVEAYGRGELRLERTMAMAAALVTPAEEIARASIP